MRYSKASDVFPAELIEEIQKYIDGEYVYIPRRKLSRRNWGDNTRTRSEIHARNQQILREYQSGDGYRVLARRYFLAEKTVAAIVRRYRRMAQQEDFS